MLSASESPSLAMGALAPTWSRGGGRQASGAGEVVLSAAGSALSTLCGAEAGDTKLEHFLTEGTLCMRAGQMCNEWVLS